MSTASFTPPAATSQRFLDTLTPVLAYCGYGRLGVRGDLGFDDKMVCIQGASLSHCLSAHAPSRLLFELRESFTTLELSAAYNDDVPAANGISADFEVFVDGERRALAKGVRPRSLPIPLSVDVRGARWLELAISTDRRRWGHTIWVTPRLLECPSGGQMYGTNAKADAHGPMWRQTVAKVGATSLVRSAAQAIGTGEHRFGWPGVVNALSTLALPLVLDDFVEQYYCYQSPRPVHRAPWVGIFHHPPGMPPFAEDRQKPQVYFQYEEFRESLAHLRGAIALSGYLATWLRSQLSVPVTVLRHPSGAPNLRWTPQRFKNNDEPKLAQIGYYLRNLCAIEQVPSLGFKRVKLLPTARSWVDDWEARCRDLWLRLRTRQWFGMPHIVGPLPVEEYDLLLSQNVVLTEVFDSSANNVIIECIARNTPVVVNRHPAVVEYLGTDYPLLFDAIEEVPDLLSSDRILAAHRHLAGLEKRWLSVDAFANGVLDFCRRVA
ncbi:MAG: NPCBM/NEW2 domain-containing protein [Verrucomicrobiales bacterium]|nr:NPCBM/NEW2 domain-containing protein [Verrucomicrobiales bacterium]